MNLHHHYLSSLFDPAAVLLVIDDGAPQWWAEPLRASSGPGPEAAQRRSAQEVLPPVEIRTPASLDAPSDPLPAGQVFELGVIAVAAPRVAGVMERLAQEGIRTVMVMAPARDADEQRAWIARAAALKMRLLGPSSTGFVRPHRGLNLGCMGGLPPVGELALVTQSGALGAALLDWAQDVGTGFSLVVALGAEGDVDIAQALDFLASDPHTRSVIVYLEAVHSARRFISALRALSLAKPVIVLKGSRQSGRVEGSATASTAVRPAAITHSGAIATSNAVYEAALRRAGAVQIQIFAQVETTARYLAARSIPVGPRLGIVSNGRGPAVLAVDQAIASGVRVPVLDEAPHNPVMLGFDATPQQMVDTLLELGEHRDLDALLIVIAPYRLLDAEEMVRTLAANARRIGLPVFAVLMGSERVRDLTQALEQAGIPVFATPEAAVNAYANVARFHQNQQLMLQMPRPLSGLLDPAIDCARQEIERALQRVGGQSDHPSTVAGGPRVLLDEVESKTLLAAFHVPLVVPRTAHDAADAVAIAETIGYPVVLKVLSPDVSHKSAAGGVALNLHGAQQVTTAFAAISVAVAAAVPGARIEGVSVQTMRGVGGSIELYVGVFRDPLWGPVMAFGAGGVAVELIRDTALELPPLNRYLARKLIERARIYPQLVRRLTAAGRLDEDLDAIERVLLRVSEMICELPQIVELDINPMIVDSTGVTVVDARFLVEPAEPVGHHYSHMAIMPYPTYLEQRLHTRNGKECTIRPIQPEDAEPLQAMVRRLSPQARYFRFVSTLSELPPRLLLRFTQIDYDREVALVATADPTSPSDGVPIIGVGRYMLNPDGESCEFAIAIDDLWQGQGLGAHLMNSLVEQARSRGLARIEGHVLASNYPMLKLMRHLGFKVGAEPEEPDMRLVWRSLQPTADPVAA